jgi:hypothetical protein
MTKLPPRSRAPWLAILALTLLAVPARAQVPQDMTFTGRLVDDGGNPLAGPVNLELRIFAAETGGTALYTEQHNSVLLDATGGFSVQLGMGTSPSGPFDAALFSEVDRWLEVVVGTEVLTPRQILGSVPWALVAQQANELVPDPTAPRFEDCGDGTVADHETGLLWEKKTGAGGGADLTNPHDVDNLYTWSTGSPYGPDGTAFTNFLAWLNGEFYPKAATGCFADRCDWQLPKISELQTLLVGPEAAPGQAQTCSSAPCIDPDFADVGGPTASSFYGSASTLAGSPGFAWFASFNFGNVGGLDKTDGNYVRAVRAGSCH